MNRARLVLPFEPVEPIVDACDHLYYYRYDWTSIWGVAVKNPTGQVAHISVSS
jgi:hypothetical protein